MSAVPPPPPAALSGAHSLEDVESLARGVLPLAVYDYIASGAADELTVAWNVEAYRSLPLRPRVQEPGGDRDTRIRLLGTELPLPVLLAPTAYQRTVHPDGELGTVRGAAAAGVPVVVSTGTNTPIEELTAVADPAPWFQLYVQSDRGFTRDLVARVAGAGCSALCLTVDTPVIGARNRQRRSGFRLADGLATPHLFDVNSGRRTVADVKRVAVTWEDVSWLRSLTSLPLLLKGILTAEDAELGLDAGAAGIVVSNHGGRNLDTLPATLHALPEVVERVDRRVPVLVDGGIRRGADVLKAMALGADAVLIGRPYLYGLAVAGAEGVERVLSILRRELEQAMAQCGVRTLTAVSAAVVQRTSGYADS